MATAATAATFQPIISIEQFVSDRNLLNLDLYPKQREILTEFWSSGDQLGLFCLGRRSGKSLMAASSAVYACCVLADGYRQFLRPNEPFYVLSVATNLEQAKLILATVKTLIEQSPILSKLIVRSTAESIELSNGCIFRSMPATARGSRGMAVAFLILDECAFFQDGEGNASGYSLYQALSPALAQFGKLARTLLTSSPWTKQGIMWDLFCKAKDRAIAAYVAQLPSWEVNPNLDEDYLDQQRAVMGAERFDCEYGAQFTGAIGAFLDPSLVDDAILHERSILVPLDKFKGSYVLSLDPAKGGRDAYTACIAHYDGDRFVVDKWHEFTPTVSDGGKKQVSISEVENWILEHHKLYGFKSVVLDQYNSQSTIQRLQGKAPIRELTWTAASKTQAFSKLRELFNSGKIELYPHPKGIQQLKNLTVVNRANGQWNVSGGAGAAVDDYALSLAGAVLTATAGGSAKASYAVPKTFFNPFGSIDKSSHQINWG